MIPAGDKQETNGTDAGQNENTSDVPGTKPSGESNSGKYRRNINS